MKVHELLKELVGQDPHAEVQVKGFIDPKSIFGRNLTKRLGLKNWPIEELGGFRREPDFYGPVYRVDHADAVPTMHLPAIVILDAGEQV